MNLCNAGYGWKIASLAYITASFLLFNTNLLITSAVNSIHFRIDTLICKLRDTPAARFPADVVRVNINSKLFIHGTWYW